MLRYFFIIVVFVMLLRFTFAVVIVLQLLCGGPVLEWMSLFLILLFCSREFVFSLLVLILFLCVLSFVLSVRLTICESSFVVVDFLGGEICLEKYYALYLDCCMVWYWFCWYCYFVLCFFVRYTLLFWSIVYFFIFSYLLCWNWWLVYWDLFFGIFDIVPSDLALE